MNTGAILKKKNHFAGKVDSFTKINNGIQCKSDTGVLLQVTIVNPHIIRFRYCHTGYFEPDFSYGLDPDYNPRAGKYTIKSSRKEITLANKNLICTIHKADMTVSIADPDGNVICEDKQGYSYIPDYHGYASVSMSKKVQSREAFYGLGDKPTELNLRGKSFVNWGVDAYEYQKNTDPLYKNIPLYYGLHHGIGYGIFFDNTFRSKFDFADKRREVTFAADGGEMNYYFIAGPELIEVCKRYTKLTGTPELPPMWALGFQQCKWSYYPEKQVRMITTKMRKLKIPCDAIYLDIDYMDGFRCFTWDKKKFPNPKKMVKDLRKQGFKTVVIIDPGIKKDNNYRVFTEAMENNYFCRRPDGPLAQGKVWPDDCYFPDFTDPKVRIWWADLYDELIEKIGVEGVWNDMNEPALFQVESKTLPEDVLHNYDGHISSHAKAHNVYGMQMVRATEAGVRKHMGGKRSLIISRSGYAGLQRYASVWTGDNSATWEHLWLADIQCQRLSISGISFSGSDIGGFVGTPTGEMMVRWVQLGIFHPFCRIHSQGEGGDQEPWSYGRKYTDMIRKLIEFRYRILPYLYTAFYHYHDDATPMLIPLVFADQAHSKTHSRDHEFLCGPHLLTTCIDQSKPQSTEIHLPEGTWYDYTTDKKHTGNKALKATYTLEQMPLFVKAGAIIPLYPLQQYVDEIEIREIDLSVYYKEGTEVSSLYEDDHSTYRYKKREYRLANFTVVGAPKKLTIKQKVSGNYTPTWNTYKLKWHGLPFAKYAMYVDGILVDGPKVDINFKKIEIKAI